MVTPLDNDALLRICLVADRQTMATFRLVSRLFAYSEELNERLFGLEHPNLNVSQIQCPSWKEQRIQRILAERNYLNGLFRKELIWSIPPKAEDVEIRVLQERPFIAYTINCTEEGHPPTFFLYDIQKKKMLSFLTPLSFDPNMSIHFVFEELPGGIHVAIRCFHNDKIIFFLLKADDESLTEIQRHTIDDNDDELLTSSKWFFCEKINSYCLAITVENRLLIWTTKTSCITKHFGEVIYIVDIFFRGKHSLLMLYSSHVGPSEKDKTSVYDLDTLEKYFILDTPRLSNGGPAKVMVQELELTLFQSWSNSGHSRNAAYSFKFSSSIKEPNILHSGRFLANAESMLTYLNGKKRYVTVLNSPMPPCKSLCLSTHHSAEFGGFFAFPTETTLIPYESQGLPTLLAQDRKSVYVLNFNFTPTPEEKRANITLKIDAFICRYWRQIRSAFGDVGLFAFYLWKARKKLP